MDCCSRWCSRADLSLKINSFLELLVLHILFYVPFCAALAGGEDGLHIITAGNPRSFVRFALSIRLDRKAVIRVCRIRHWYVAVWQSRFRSYGARKSVVVEILRFELRCVVSASKGEEQCCGSILHEERCRILFDDNHYVRLFYVRLYVRLVWRYST
jgi:hypothetical protein